MSKIEHIFNEHKANKKREFIVSQEFEIDFIKDYTKAYKNKNFLINNDFSKRYYEALKPSKDDSIISKYDDEKLNNLIENLGKNILMISGDFWGIQKFIFDGLVSSKAAKILRSRSAMVQLITHVIVDIVKQNFKDSEAVLFGAGKFLILAKKEDSYLEQLNGIQKELNKYFLKNYFGQNGFILSSSLTTNDRILNQSDNEEIKIDLQNLANDNNIKKYNKFNLVHAEDNKICIDVFKNVASDDNICKFCSKRAVSKDDTCEVCANQIALGEKLTKNKYISIYNSNNKNDDILLFKYKEQNYYAKFFDNRPQNHLNTFDISSEKYDNIAKWSLNSYVAKNKTIKTFEELQNNSQGLIALKADVDKLGDTFREYYMSSFKKFNRLSRELDFFFSDYATSLMKNKNLYTIFAGGDDLFLVGEYRDVVDYAKELREEFYRFSLQKATLSMGLVMFKHSTPINYVSNLADESEARAKATSKDGKDRDGIDIFGISMKFEEFLEIEKDFNKIVEFLENNGVDTTTFYYRLIELSQMKEDINKDIKNAMWRSKLNYIIRRNISKENNDFDIYKKLINLVENYGKKIQPTIFLKIYENRDKINKGDK